MGVVAPGEKKNVVKESSGKDSLTGYTVMIPDRAKTTATYVHSIAVYIYHLPALFITILTCLM